MVYVFFVKLFIIFDNLFFSCYDYYRCGDIMDKVYDFNWIVSEIDHSIILKLLDDDKLIGIYQVSDIGYEIEDVEVKFANVADLIKFINHCGIIFRDVNDSNNIIRIPIRKILLLFSYSNTLDEDGKKSIKVNNLEAFMMRGGELLKGNYQIQAYKVNDESDELKEVMEIAYKFGNMGMQETIDALEKVNLVNYHKTSGTKSA